MHDHDSLMPAQAALFRDARNTFGLVDRIDKTIEECGELIVSLQHLKARRGSLEQVVDEIADVQIMSCQLAQAFGDSKVAAVRQYKLDRLARLVCGQHDGEAA